jgi:hypothetical protein
LPNWRSFTALRPDRLEKGFSKAIRATGRANIMWRQDVGGCAIEASKIAGHSKADTRSSAASATKR